MGLHHGTGPYVILLGSAMPGVGSQLLFPMASCTPCNSCNPCKDRFYTYELRRLISCTNDSMIKHGYIQRCHPRERINFGKEKRFTVFLDMLIISMLYFCTGGMKFETTD